MSYRGHSQGISKCAAEWLNVHRAFNQSHNVFNAHPTTAMLPPTSLVSPPNAIRFRFEVADRDGIHQVQLLTPTLQGIARDSDEMLACRQLNGNTSNTVEFITTGLAPTSESVRLQIIDVHGNFRRSESYPINVSALDNTLEGAIPLPLNNSLTGEIAPGDDLDYFSIQTTDPGQLTVWTTGSLDTVGALQNSEGTTLAANDDGKRGLNFRIVHEVAPGTYYVKVESYESNTGSYTVHADFAPAVSADVNDVNGDGVVDVADLVVIAENYGSKGENVADVNDDGVVDAEDFVLVAGEIPTEEPPAAPSARRQALPMLSAQDVRQILTEAQALNLTDPAAQRGIWYLQQLLAALIPQETALLANYPNPFNPETWIPYQLTHDAHVTLTVYDVKGRMVRLMEMGHQLAGFYTARGDAVYWDGKNTAGEIVGSGVYFYTLRAGEYAATRKMLIRK